MKKVCTLLLVAMSFWANSAEAQTSYTSGYLGNTYYSGSTLYTGNMSFSSGYVGNTYYNGSTLYLGNSSYNSGYIGNTYYSG